MFSITNKKLMIEFAQSMIVQELKDGQKIYEVGDNPDYFYVINKGSVRFCSEHCPDIEFMKVKSGNYFGEHELLHDDSRKFICIADEPTQVYKISKNLFNVLFVETDKMLAKVFKELAEQRYLDFKEASEMLNKEFEDKTDDIRDEKKKTNKFWKIHRAVYSKKFRLLVEDMVKPKNNFEMMRQMRSRHKYAAMEVNYQHSKKKKFNLEDDGDNVISMNRTKVQQQTQPLEKMQLQQEDSVMGSRSGHVSKLLRRRQTINNNGIRASRNINDEMDRFM